MKTGYKRVCSNCLKHDVKFIGTTPNGDQWLCAGRCSWNVTPCFLAVAPPVESVTMCGVCGKELDGYSNKKTCSAKCRKALSRMSVTDGKPVDLRK